MPKYQYECGGCSIRFERTHKRPEPTPCPECGQPAPQIMTGFGFQFADSPGTDKANTGVTKVDYPTADQAVGRSADLRWKMMKERDAVKAEARKQGGTNALIRRHSGRAIDYEPMSQAGREARKQLAKTALKPSTEK